MIWHVISQVGPSDIFAPIGKPRLVISLNNPAGQHQVSNHILETLYKNGLGLDDVVIDLLHLAMSVYAADLRVGRRYSEDHWTRDIALYLPVAEPDRWEPVLPTITRLLSFLTGDRWTIYLRLREAFSKPKLKPQISPLPNLVTLFSGGLDSFVGAIDLLEQSNGVIALVGQYGKGSTYSSQKKLHELMQKTYKDRVVPLSFFVQPGKIRGEAAEDTMRSRSILFLALGTAVASACGEGTPLYISENGLISLNVPLTYSRMGSLSTRTTHPYVISLYRDALSALGINIPIELPYRFFTKGEMLKKAQNRDVLRKGLPLTLSCSRPDSGRFQKRPPGTHCGYCVPCIIRLASIKAGGFSIKKAAYFDVISEQVDPKSAKGKDVRAFEIAVERAKTLSPLHLTAEVLNTGPLPPQEIQEYVGVYKRGIKEVGQLLQRRAKQ